MIFLDIVVSSAIHTPMITPAVTTFPFFFWFGFTPSARGVV